MIPLTLLRVPGRFAICRLAPDASVPAWAHSGRLSSVSRTPDELSIVCADDQPPADVVAERGWTCLSVAGPLDLAEIGVLASLSAALAQRGISVFALSTFDTDHVLVHERDLDAAVAALAASGHHVVDDASSEEDER